MEKKKFIKNRIQIIASLLGRNTSYKDLEKEFDELIQFGRDNPETCKMKLVDEDNNYYECNKCGFPLGLNVGTPKDNNYQRCPLCGRKIIHEN